MQTPTTDARCDGINQDIAFGPFSALEGEEEHGLLIQDRDDHRASSTASKTMKTSSRITLLAAPEEEHGPLTQEMITVLHPCKQSYGD